MVLRKGRDILGEILQFRTDKKPFDIYDVDGNVKKILERGNTCECVRNNLRVTLSQNIKDDWCVSVMRLEPMCMTYRLAATEERARAVYRELEEHVLNSDRTWEELNSILQNKI